MYRIVFRIGLAAVVGVFLTALWGVAAKYCSGFIKNYIRPINTKLYHATLALVVFCLGMAAICLACYSNWVRRRVDGYFWRLMFFTPIVLAVCMARQVDDLFSILVPYLPTSVSLSFCPSVSRYLSLYLPLCQIILIFLLVSSSVSFFFFLLL